MKLLTINEKGDLIELNKLEFDTQNVYLIDDNNKNTVFIWVGLDVPQYKKDITAAWARKFDKDRGGTCKILIMKQDREYGSFLSMMDELKKGLIPGETIERRPELILKEPTESPKLVFDIEAQEEKEDDFGARVSAGLAELEEYNKLEIEAPVDKPDESVIVLESLGFEEIIEEVVEEDIDEEDEEEIGLESQIREAAYYLSLKKYSYNDLCWLLAETIQNINLGMPSLEEIRKKAEEVYNSSSTYDELCWLNAEMDLLIKQHYLEKETRDFF
ncbi:MAG: hypothetical protein CEE42_13925 [Promethearchaeota archaeon Loki_b31]|nr:MAG: hypothetical protein CEE42_13925 [Candidatus Lokiarchaeota archaeon Loki_b31]